MHRSVATAALVLGALGMPSAASCQRTVELKPDYEQILKQVNGRYTKHGWNHYGPGHFDLDSETGVLTARGGMGLFWYAARQYADFVLDFEFKTPSLEANSGVFLRVPEVPTSNDYIYHSFEVQIDDRAEGIHHTGGVFDAEAPRARASRGAGEWNHCEITFQGRRITVVLNDQRVVDWEAEPRGKVRDVAARGFIGLQNHDDRSAVQFRNIYVKELPSPAR